MSQIIGLIKAVIQLIMLVRQIQKEWNAYQEKKREAERIEREQERQKIEEEIRNGNLTEKEKRDLLDRLNRNLPF